MNKLLRKLGCQHHSGSSITVRTHVRNTPLASRNNPLSSPPSWNEPWPWGHDPRAPWAMWTPPQVGTGAGVEGWNVEEHPRREKQGWANTGPCLCSCLDGTADSRYSQALGRSSRKAFQITGAPEMGQGRGAACLVPRARQCCF